MCPPLICLLLFCLRCFCGGQRSRSFFTPLAGFVKNAPLADPPLFSLLSSFLLPRPDCSGMCLRYCARAHAVLPGQGSALLRARTYMLCYPAQHDGSRCHARAHAALLGER